MIIESFVQVTDFENWSQAKTDWHGTSGTLSRLLVRGHGIHDRSALHTDTAMSSLDNRDASVTSEIMSWAQLRNCTDSEHANPAHKSESPR